MFPDYTYAYVLCYIRAIMLFIYNNSRDPVFNLILTPLKQTSATTKILYCCDAIQILYTNIHICICRLQLHCTLPSLSARDCSISLLHISILIVYMKYMCTALSIIL